MIGVVNLDKPVGPTSHDMVALLRRITGTRRIGHAGTLDPLASGVLPILIGAATRFSQELTGGEKAYLAVIRLGQRSATDDAEGPLTEGGPLPTEAAVQAELAKMVGTQLQQPPRFSARKLDGQRAHRAARAGRPLEVAPRLVSVNAIEVLRVDHRSGLLDVEVAISCGPGTYIRSIARDLGERVGSGGHLALLRRTRAAGLDVATAVTPERLSELAAGDRFSEALLPIGPLLGLPELALAGEDLVRFVHGQGVRVPGSASGRHAVFDRAELVGLGTLDGGVLQPDKVIGPVEAA